MTPEPDIPVYLYESYYNLNLSNPFQMLDMLTLGWSDFNPTAISMDYEMALMNSFGAYFPDAEIHGCSFHLVQNLKKKVAAHGLSPKYRRDPGFALHAKTIPALAFIPVDRLENALRDLRDQLPQDLQPVLDYFEDNYIGRLQLRNDGFLSRREASFPVSMWTVHQRTLDGDSRTNNYVEALHRSLQQQFSVSHPGLLIFIDGIRTA